MTPEILIELAQRAADCATIDGPDSTIVGATFGELADGSRRHYALVEIDTYGLQQTYRVASPAPSEAPAWATREWTYEVRVGDGWLDLEVV